MSYRMINKATGRPVGMATSEQKEQLEKDPAYSGIRFVEIEQKANEKTEASKKDEKADKPEKAATKAKKD